LVPGSSLGEDPESPPEIQPLNDLYRVEGDGLTLEMSGVEREIHP
jgi:hypothetical protein